jgi:hypothetical protein
LLDQWVRKAEAFDPAVERPDPAGMAGARSGSARLESFEDEARLEHRSGFDRRRMSRPGSDRRIDRNGTIG